METVMPESYNLEPAITLPAIVFRWKHLWWIPHYTEKKIYVAPGGMRMSEEDLMRLGASMQTLPLWPRPWQLKEREVIP
jgi:hypothetical protein